MLEHHPIHLAIIPDGNRRWARAQGLFPWKGHEKAIDRFREMLEWCRRSGRICVLTFWCFSTENWKRDRSEIDELMQLLLTYIEQERATLIENRIHLIRSGRSDRVPPSLIAHIDSVERETAKDPVMTLHMALDYGGKDEITRAVNRTSGGGALTEEDIRSHLDHPELPDIDLIIRTSGEMRTSNFFLWQSAHAEWMFMDTFFPDVTSEDLARAVEAFESRKRRFGG